MEFTATTEGALMTRTAPKPVDPRKREVPLLTEIARLEALIADLTIYDRANRHPVSREVWAEARAIAAKFESEPRPASAGMLADRQPYSHTERMYEQAAWDKRHGRV